MVVAGAFFLLKKFLKELHYEMLNEVLNKKTGGFSRCLCCLLNSSIRKKKEK